MPALSNIEESQVLSFYKNFLKVEFPSSRRKKKRKGKDRPTEGRKFSVAIRSSQRFARLKESLVEVNPDGLIAVGY